MMDPDCQREGHQWFHSQICGAWFCLRCGCAKETPRRVEDCIMWTFEGAEE